MSRSPDQLARIIEDGLDYTDDELNMPHTRLVRAALTELQAQAEAGQRLRAAALAVVRQPWRHISEASLQALRAAAVPSPADTEAAEDA